MLLLSIFMLVREQSRHKDHFGLSVKNNAINTSSSSLIFLDTFTREQKCQERPVFNIFKELKSFLVDSKKYIFCSPFAGNDKYQKIFELFIFTKLFIYFLVFINVISCSYHCVLMYHSLPLIDVVVVHTSCLV